MVRPWPATVRKDVIDDVHGTKIVDAYRWLEDHKAAAVTTWVGAQDAYARASIAKLPGRDVLAARLKRLSYVAWTSAPQRRGKRYFFRRQHPDKEKVVYYFRNGLKGKDQILLDPNTLSADGSVAVRGVSVSYNGKKAAYKLSRNNADASTLYVKDVGTGKDSKVDVIPGAKYAWPSWTPKSDGFYYTRLPTDKSIPIDKLPGYAQVYFHTLGKDPAKDRLVHDKLDDPTKFIHADITRDGRHLFVYIYHGWTKTDVFYRDLKRRGKMGKLQPFMVGVKAKFDAYGWKNHVYLRTDLDAPRYRLFKIKAGKMARKQWREIVPEDKEAVLKGFSIVGGHLSLNYLRRASTELKIATLAGKPLRSVVFPGIGSADGLTGHPDDDAAYYSFQSFITPRTVYKTSVRKGGRDIYDQIKLPIDTTPFAVEQVTYPSKDGTKVSMFIAHRKDMKKDGNNPLLLYGYGGFNISLTPRFRSSFFVWLEQGGSIAIPNLRGGGEYGEEWHRGGMLLAKQNVFDDFIAAAEFLIKKGYTKTSRLAIRGGSNGGLLVGAAMTQRPDLFQAVACHVPLLDMVRYHLFGSGKTWISEYGSADDATQFKAIHAYSPYHRVKEKTAYPALLMMSADSDDRVDPVHARKFTAAIQHATTSAHPVIMRVETKAGHGGGDMIKKTVDARTDEFAFLFAQIGVTPKETAAPKAKAAR